MAKKRPKGAAGTAGKARRHLVGLEPELHAKIGMLAAAQHLSVPEYVDLRLRPIVEKELPEVLRRMGLAP